MLAESVCMCYSRECRYTGPLAQARLYHKTRI